MFVGEDPGTVTDFALRASVFEHANMLAKLLLAKSLTS